MTDLAEQDQRTATAEALPTALAAGDLETLERLLAPDVHWHGSAGGACHGRDEVLGVLRAQRDHGVVARPTDHLLVGDRLLLDVDLSSGQPVVGGVGETSWLVVAALDDDGRIAHLQDYTDAATARDDLALRARSAAAGASGASPPAGAVTGLAPLLHVTDVDRSAAFYGLLGFEVHATHRHDDRLDWARLQSPGAALMLAAGEEAVDAHDSALLLWLHSPDLAGLRADLVAAGVLAAEILDGTPGPRRQMRVIDPDGYCLMISQTED